MITFLEGTLAESMPTHVIVAVQGVGWRKHMNTHPIILIDPAFDFLNVIIRDYEICFCIVTV